MRTPTSSMSIWSYPKQRPKSSRVNESNSTKVSEIGVTRVTFRERRHWRIWAPTTRTQLSTRSKSRLGNWIFRWMPLLGRWRVNLRRHRCPRIYWMINSHIWPNLKKRFPSLSTTQMLSTRRLDSARLMTMKTRMMTIDILPSWETKIPNGKVQSRKAQSDWLTQAAQAWFLWNRSQVERIKYHWSRSHRDALMCAYS